MNLMIIFLVLVSLLLPNSAAFILEPNGAFNHVILLTQNLTKTSDFSFTFSKTSSNCPVKKTVDIEFSVGSAKSGSSSILFDILTDDYNENEIYVDLKTKDNIAARDYGKIFQVTLKSKDKIELVADGKIPPRLSPTIISNELNFEKYNETHLGIVFYAIIKDLANQKCSYHFDFPDYVELKAKRFLPTPPPSLPSGNATLSQIPATSTPKSDKSGSEETKTSSTLIYVCAAVASLLLGIIISGIASYFLLPKLSYFKPPNNDDATKIDAEKTKFVNQDETKQTKTISKAENNTTTKQQTLNGIPTIDSYNGGRTTGNA